MRKLHYAFLTTSNQLDEGGKNEDAVLINSKIYSSESAEEGTFESQALHYFAVSDGLHGTSKNSHPALELLSLLKCDLKQHRIAHPGQRITRMHEEFSTLASKKAAFHGMAATLVAVEIESNMARVFHVGDSRAWLVSKKLCRPLTVDHTVANSEQFKSRIELAAVSNMLDQYFVVDSFSPRPINSLLDVKFDYDDVLILASDGISIIGELIPCVDSDESMGQYIRRLRSTAVSMGSDDNISIVAIRIE